MSITLSTLVSRVEVNAPARDGVPTSGQYERAVRDAVIDFNNRATRLRSAIVDVISGTADYALPADFWKFAALVHPPVRRGGIVITSAIIPLPRGWPDEKYTITNGQLHIDPTPAYSARCVLEYGAGFVESSDPITYADMTEREAQIILLLAESFARGRQEIDESAGVTSYAQGDVKISFAGAGSTLQSASANLFARYEDAVRRYIGTITIQG